MEDYLDILKSWRLILYVLGTHARFLSEEMMTSSHHISERV